MARYSIQRWLFSLVFACGAVFLTAACSETSVKTEEIEGQPEVAELLGQGEAMVENLCAGCHAVGAKDESAHPDAFALRDLSKRLDIKGLRSPLNEGMIVDHPDMPIWAFEPHHVDALIFYLESIQTD